MTISEIADAAEGVDLNAVFQAWNSAQVADDEMETLTVTCTIGDILKWAKEARASLLATVSDAPEAVAVKMDARQLVRLQARYLDFLGEMAGWRLNA